MSTASYCAERFRPTSGRSRVSCAAMEQAGENRARIAALERETERTRERVHRLEGEAAAARFLGQQVKELALDIREMTRRIEELAKHVLIRPSPTGISAFANLAAVLVALAALAISLTR